MHRVHRQRVADLVGIADQDEGGHGRMIGTQPRAIATDRRGQMCAESGPTHGGQHVEDGLCAFRTRGRVEGDGIGGHGDVDTRPPLHEGVEVLVRERFVAHVAGARIDIAHEHRLGHDRHYS